MLVAFTILALMLTVLLRIFSDGFRGMSAAEAHATAALHAQAALAGVGSEIPLAVGEWAGEYGDGFRWEVSIEPYQEPALTRFAALVPALPRVRHRHATHRERAR